jgi:hypothetical protein
MISTSTLKIFFAMTGLLLFVVTPATPAQVAAPCCTITTINPSAGVVTAKVNATGKTFQFKATQQLLHTLKVGQGVYANFKTQQVSVDGRTPSGTIISTATVASRNHTIASPSISTAVGTSGTSTSTSTGSGSSGSSGQGGTTASNTPCSAPTPVIQAAVDLLTASGTLLVAPQCSSDPHVSCDGNNHPLKSTLQLIRKDVNTSQSGTACRFSASLSLVTPNPIPLSYGGLACVMAVNTHSPVTESGDLSVTNNASAGSNTYRVTAANMQLSGMQAADISITAPNGEQPFCSSANFPQSFATGLVETAIANRAPNAFCFAVTGQSQAKPVKC